MLAGPHPDPVPAVDRHPVATAFVAWNGKLMLHRHPKLGIWLPCGGHVEVGESPDQAALREVLEESGVAAYLVGEPAIEVSEPRQMIPPRGVQIESIAPGHEHIDFIYFARPIEPYDGTFSGSEPGLGWYSQDEVAELPLTEEMLAWAQLVFSELIPTP